MTKTPSANSLDTNYQEVRGQTDQLLHVASSGNIHPTPEHQILSMISHYMDCISGEANEIEPHPNHTNERMACLEVKETSLSFSEGMERASP